MGAAAVFVFTAIAALTLVAALAVFTTLTFTTAWTLASAFTSFTRLTTASFAKFDCGERRCGDESDRKHQGNLLPTTHLVLLTIP
jgi:hypothetical protein